MSEPLFVLGCPRSGTTFLSQLIQYSEYGEPVESHFITKYYRKFSNVHEEVDEKFLVQVVADILSERAVMQWGLGLDPVRVVAQLPIKSYKAVVDYLIGLRFSKLGYKLWSDKTPHYIMDFDIIYDLYPNAKYIFIIRDGRDVALSLLNEKWGPNNIYYCAKLWCECNMWSRRLESLRNNKRLFFVVYEQLLDNTKEISRGMYDFLDVSYPEKAADKIIKKVMVGNYNKWQERMTKQQVNVFESVGGDTLESFGYKLSGVVCPIPLVSKLFYKIHNGFVRVKFLFIHNVVDGFKIKFLGKQPFGE